MATQKKTLKKAATPPKKRATAPRSGAATKKVAASAKQHAVAQLATVPEYAYFTDYISRTFLGGHSEFDIFDYAYANARNVLIEGPTGPGKTSASLAYAAKKKLSFYAIPTNIGIEPSQLFGKYIPGAGGGFVWQDGPVTDIIRNGGLLLINEVNFLMDRVATVLFGLLDKRREIQLLDHKGEVVAAHRGGGKGKCWCTLATKVCDSKRVLVVADMNPDYEGTRPLNKAFRNRFAIQLDWDYDENIERQLVKSGSLVDMASALRQEAAKGGFETPISTNMLQEFETIMTDLGFDFATTNFVQHFGADERAAVLQVVKTYRQNIIDDYDTDDSDDDESDDDWGVEGVDWVYEDEADDDNDTKVRI